MNRTALFFAGALLAASAASAQKAPLPALPAAQAIPKPGPDTGQPYAPQAILPGGVVVPLFPPNSPYLKADKVHVPEVYNMSQAVQARSAAASLSSSRQTGPTTPRITAISSNPRSSATR